MWKGDDIVLNIPGRGGCEIQLLLLLLPLIDRPNHAICEVAYRPCAKSAKICSCAKDRWGCDAFVNVNNNIIRAVFYY